MTQDQVLILVLKVVLISAAVSIAAFVGIYHRLTHGGVWGNEIGRTIIWKDVLLLACLLPSIMSLFLHFSRLTSHVAAWTDIALFGLITPAMWWRSWVFARIHNGKEEAGGGEQAPDGDPGP